MAIKCEAVRMHTRYLLSTLLCTALSPTIVAQNRGATKVYKDQFMELHQKTTAMLARAEQEVKNNAPAEDRSELRHENLALTKLVHRLEEESARSYVDDSKSVQNPDKDLLVIESGCDQLGFVLGALDSYLDTGDSAFLGFAKKGSELVSSIELLL
jgi:hypothetical protein